MARARSPDSIEAEKLYHDGMKLVDIAKKLGVPDGTVRRWKSTQKWDGEKPNNDNERSKKKKPNVRKKTGAPKGNKNAVGHKGANTFEVGNKNGVKHGAYSNVYWDTLDEDEKNMIDDMPKDEEELIIEQIQLFSIRERRIMIAINKYRNQMEPVVIMGVIRNEDKRSFKDAEERAEYESRQQEKIDNKERLPGERYHITTQTENKDNLIARLEKELSTVQSKKTKAIDTLVRLRLERQKIDGESKGNEVVRTWADAVLKARGEKHE